MEMNETTDTGTTINYGPPTPANPRILGWSGGVLLLLGAALMIFGVSFLRDANASRSWPVAAGQVRNVNVTWSRSASDDVGERSYYFEVTYGYEVDGRSYTGKRFSLGDGNNAAGRTYRDESDAIAASEAYRRGAAVDVYVDPTDPENTVLKPGASFATYVPLGLGAFFVLCGGALLWLFFRSRTAES